MKSRRRDAAVRKAHEDAVEVIHGDFDRLIMCVEALHTRLDVLDDLTRLVAAVEGLHTRLDTIADTLASMDDENKAFRQSITVGNGGR